MVTPLLRGGGGLGSPLDACRAWLWRMASTVQYVNPEQNSSPAPRGRGVREGLADAHFSPLSRIPVSKEVGPPSAAAEESSWPAMVFVQFSRLLNLNARMRWAGINRLLVQPCPV
jgi:hypothetical protein